MDLIPGSGRFHVLQDPWARGPQLQSLCSQTVTSEPVCRNYWSLCTCSLCSTMREVIAMRNSCTTTREEPPLAATRERPNAAKNKKINLNTSWASQVMIEVMNMPVSAGDVRDVRSIPGLGRSLGGGHGNSLQYLCLENPMDREAWRAAVHKIPQSQTQLRWLSMYARTQLEVWRPKLNW